ncbi:hypothetical protein ACCS56_37435, partial [Rhizobium ruizarguesonis]
QINPEHPASTLQSKNSPQNLTTKPRNINSKHIYELQLHKQTNKTRKTKPQKNELKPFNHLHQSTSKIK